MENLIDNMNNITMSNKLNTTDNEDQIINKSLESGCNNKFPDLIKKKDVFQIKLTSSNTHIQISSKSANNIFKKISKNNNLEDNYFDNILFLISNENETEGIESDIDNLTAPLDPLFADLLNKTKTYYISFIHKKNYINNHKHINLTNNSLSKIFRFLDSDILQMNDYIDIVISDDQEYEYIEKGILSRTRILSRSSHSIYFDEEEEFNGHRLLYLEKTQPKKSKKNNLSEISKYFDNVIFYIENKDKYNNSIGNNNLIGINNNNSELDDFVVQYIPSSHTQELRKRHIRENSKKNEYIENCYDQLPCSAMCKIF